MDLKRLADRAKALVEKRGGTGALKGDAAELKEIAGRQGSLADKAKAAAAALKNPGADASPGVPDSGVPTPDPTTSQPSADDHPGRRGRRRNPRAGGRRARNRP